MGVATPAGAVVGDVLQVTPVGSVKFWLMHVFALALQGGAADDRHRRRRHRNGKLEGLRRTGKDVDNVSIRDRPPIALPMAPSSSPGLRWATAWSKWTFLACRLSGHGEIGKRAVAVERVARGASLVQNKGARARTDGRNRHYRVTGVVDDGDDARRCRRRRRNHDRIGSGLRRRAAGINRRNHRPVCVAATGNQSCNRKGRARLNQAHTRPA